MDARALDLLEFDAVRERLAGRTSFDGGRARALSLAPAGDTRDVAARVARTEEAVLLLSRLAPAPAGAHALGADLTLAARGGTLDEARLERVLATVETAREVRAKTLSHRDLAPELCAALAGLDDGALAGLAGHLDRALDRRGGLADGASPELGRLRRQLAAARADVSATQRDLARRLASHLQEGFVTERRGRPVLAVKAASRAAVPGIVHDSSGSGQTLFVEPYALVEATNLASEIAGAEREERDRILAELSGAVAARADELGHTVDVLADHDLALASAGLSLAWKGCVVERADEVELTGARHPLLDPDTAVPVDLPLAGLRGLVVSGPNAGGKTVALKTLGLLSLVHQCGLRVPARRARLPVFSRILVDIGDRQSIAESLSTFSAHARELGRVLAAAGPGTLALLDEVASGTDPREGAALARAVIARLATSGALVVATTHHWELKAWAAETPGIANAAVAVDPDTLRPRYTLTVGAPGASHAFAIAASCGVPDEVIAAARRELDAGADGVERLLVEAGAARAAAAREREAAEEARRTSEELRGALARREEEMARRLAEGAERAREERERARRDAAARLEEATSELAELRRLIAAARREEARRGRTGGGGKGAARERDRRIDEASRTAERARAAIAHAAERPSGPVAGVGDTVLDPELGFRGVVAALEGDQAIVQGDGARVRLPLGRLVVRAGAPPPEDVPPRRQRETRPPIAAVPAEVDVRGERAERARAIVRAAVDAAAPVGRASFRVIHGRGTGALRVAVREELTRHPLVLRHEAAGPREGGDGATVVVLAEEGGGG